MAEITESARPYGVPLVDTQAERSYPQGRDNTFFPLPDSANAEWQAAQSQDAEDAILAEAQAQEARVLWDRDSKLGAIVKPTENTLEAYRYINDAGIYDVNFLPTGYTFFDGTIVDKAGRDEKLKPNYAAFDKNNPNYATFAPLRKNIGILRNYIAANLFEDRVYNEDDPRDHARVAQMKNMAEKLGEQLMGGHRRPNLVQRWIISMKRFFTGQDLSKPIVSEFMYQANLPDSGIATMYNYLLNEQAKSNANWNLPPLEKSPFSQSNMCGCGVSMLRIASGFTKVATQLRSPDALPLPKRQISIELGRKILENFRLQMGEGENASLSVSPAGKPFQARKLLRASFALRNNIYDLNQMCGANAVQNAQYIQRAVGCIEKLNYYMLRDAAAELEGEGNSEAAAALRQRADEMPSEAKTPFSLVNLVTELDAGLQEAGQMRDVYLKSHPGEMFSQGVGVGSPQAAAQQATEASRSTMASGTVSQASHPDAVKMAEEVNRQRGNQSHGPNGHGMGPSK